MSFDTNNPMPSTSLRDLSDNAENFDEGMNSTDESFTDRFGRPRVTWQAFHNLTINAKNQIDVTVTNAQNQVRTARDSGLVAINADVTAVDAAAADALADMLETAENLGADLNNKRYATYALMLADPQTRNNVVAVVDNDPNAALNGWYFWNRPSNAWVRFVDQPVFKSQFDPVNNTFQLITQFATFSQTEELGVGELIADADGRYLYRILPNGTHAFYSLSDFQGVLKSNQQLLGGQGLRYLDSTEYELSGHYEVLVDENFRILSNSDEGQDLSNYATKTEVQTLLKNAPLRPGQLRFALLGDSRFAMAFDNNKTASKPRGPAFWGQLLSRGAARFSGVNNFGVSGETTAQIRARVAAVAAADVEAVVVLCGVNDAANAPSLANIQGIVDALKAAGKIVIVIAELPRGLTSPSTWDTDRIQQHWRLHQGILQMASQGGVRVANAMPYLVDPNSTAGAFKDGTAYSLDSVHLTGYGGYWVGRAVADVIQDLCKTPAQAFESIVDVYSATQNPTGNLLANGLLTGTSGTLAGTGNPTGQVAANWGLFATASFSVTASKVTVAGRQMQQISYSGTPVNTGQYITFFQNITVANLSAGDSFEVMCELEVDAGSIAMYGPELDVMINMGSTYETDLIPIVSAGWQDMESPNPPVAYSGLLITQRATLTAVPSEMRVQVRIRGAQGVASSGVFRIGNISFRKLFS